MSNNFVVSGPSSFEIYYNEEAKKKIMFIGDVHTVPEQEAGEISLNEFYDMIKLRNQGPVAFLTEGGKCQTAADITNDCSLASSQLYNIAKKKFKMYWCDYRFQLPTYQLHMKLIILTEQLGMYYRNYANIRPEGITLIKKSIKDLIPYLISLGKFKFNDSFMSRYIKSYDDFRGMLKQSRGSTAASVFRYINKYVLKGKSSDEYIANFKNKMSGIIKVVKELPDVLNGTEPGRAFNLNVRAAMDLLKIVTDLENTIFEAYVLGLLLSLDFNRFIVHLGQMHTDKIARFMKKKLGYKLYYQGNQVRNQAVEIQGLRML
jgi:hypothetical protein